MYPGLYLGLYPSLYPVMYPHVPSVYVARYDGEGPAAFFYGGSGGRPSGNGFQIANEKVKLVGLKG